MVRTERPDVADLDVWTGEERRDSDRRADGERRTKGREDWERRSGQDRRGHRLYSRPRPRPEK